MRGALPVLALILGLASGAADAQAEKDAQSRARERTARDPATDHRGHTVSKDSQPPKGAPSKAQQMQQQQYDQRLGQERLGDGRAQGVQCHARPVCVGGGFGVCQEVVRTYPAGTNFRSSRRDIVLRCRQANLADPCQCAQQCELVAQCSNF